MRKKKETCRPVHSLDVSSVMNSEERRQLGKKVTVSSLLQKMNTSLGTWCTVTVLVNAFLALYLH